MRDEGQDEDDDKAAGDYPVDWLATIQNFPPRFLLLSQTKMKPYDA
jgi:hypothetical protein